MQRSPTSSTWALRSASDRGRVTNQYGRDGHHAEEAERVHSYSVAHLPSGPPRCYYLVGLSALSSAPMTVSREGDGYCRGKGEKPDEEQKQIAGFAWSHDIPAMKVYRRVIAPSPQPGAKAQKHRGARNAPSFHRRSRTLRNSSRLAMHRHKNAIEIPDGYPIAALQIKSRSPGGTIDDWFGFLERSASLVGNSTLKASRSGESARKAGCIRTRSRQQRRSSRRSI